MEQRAGRVSHIDLIAKICYVTPARTNFRKRNQLCSQSPMCGLGGVLMLLK